MAHMLALSFQRCSTNTTAQYFTHYTSPLLYTPGQTAGLYSAVESAGTEADTMSLNEPSYPLMNDGSEFFDTTNYDWKAIEAEAFGFELIDVYDHAYLICSQKLTCD